MTILYHECYVSLETAKLLKKAGFDWKIKSYYLKGLNGIFETTFMPNNFNDGTLTDWISAPTIEVAQKWLREVEHLDIIVDRNHPIHEPLYSWEYEYVIIATDGRVEAVDCYFDEYEQALEAGIKKALEIILEKGE